MHNSGELNLLRVESKMGIHLNIQFFKLYVLTLNTFLQIINNKLTFNRKTPLQFTTVNKIPVN